MACPARTIRTPASRRHGLIPSSPRTRSPAKTSRRRTSRSYERPRSDPDQLLPQRDVWQASRRPARRKRAFLWVRTLPPPPPTGLIGSLSRTERIYGSGYGTNAAQRGYRAGSLYQRGHGARRGRYLAYGGLATLSRHHISGWGLQMAELQNDDLQLSNAQLLRRRQREHDRVPADRGQRSQAWTISNART